jgi:hypothetical protein
VHRCWRNETPYVYESVASAIMKAQAQVDLTRKICAYACSSVGLGQLVPLHYCWPVRLVQSSSLSTNQTEAKQKTETLAVFDDMHAEQ